MEQEQTVRNDTDKGQSAVERLVKSVFDSSFIETTGGILEIGKNYIYKESMPSCLFLFRLDDIQKGHLDHGTDWVTLTITILKSLTATEDDNRQTTLGFRANEQVYFGGMWRIYDEGTYRQYRVG